MLSDTSTRQGIILDFIYSKLSGISSPFLGVNRKKVNVISQNVK